MHLGDKNIGKGEFTRSLGGRLTVFPLGEGQLHSIVVRPILVSFLTPLFSQQMTLALPSKYIQHLGQLSS